MKKEIILFDVDGTIFDSYPGIKHCIEYALSNLEYSIDNIDFRKFVGPPLKDSFKKYCRMNDELATRAVNLFRKEYKRVGNKMYQCYDGILFTIRELYNKGYKLGVATSKPEEMAKLMFDEAGLSKYFNHIVGADSSGKEDKIDVLKDACKRFAINEMDSCVLIGDTIYDYEACEELGIDCIIVKYGFGDEKLFSKSKNIVEQPREILEILNGEL